MSTEFNEWDWNNTDWNNGWTNTVSQNFNRPPPKETGLSSHVSQQNRGPTNESYEKGWDDWTQSNHTAEVRGHGSSNLYSTINNNMLNQVENREIAPPDNKQFSYESSKSKPKPTEMSNLGSQHLNNMVPASKVFQVQHLPHTGVKQHPNHINDYFEPKPINQNLPAQPNPFYSQPVQDGYNAQMISSGPSNFTNMFPHHQQQLEKEASFPSLGGHHHLNTAQNLIMKQIPSQDEVNQNIDSRTKRFTPSPQQRIPITQSVQLPPPSANSNHHTITPSEGSDSNGIVKANPSIGNPPSFQVANMNVMAPIATSSPIGIHNTLLPENQERIPDNREYPDNKENIAQDLQALSINSPKEQVEQETQKHCAVDRNQYLETGHFSSRKENSTYLQNTEINDEGEAPPPGLHRLVTGQGCEPWKVEMDNWSEKDVNQVPATPSVPSLTRHSSPLSSIGESEIRDDDEERRREVPGEAEPLQGRVVLGQVPTPPQDAPTARGDRERERLERMVVGEQVQSGGNTSDDYRQPGRQKRHQRHRRTDSSYEEEERDYSSDRDRRNEDHRRRDDRPRRRREQRSPEYRSDDEYEDRRGFHRSGRESRRTREYSPDRSYYRDYRDYRGDDSRSHRRYYGREYDDYYRENQRSRPSSRSGSDYRHQIKQHPVRMMHGTYYHDSWVSSFHDYNLKYSQRTAEYFERMRLLDPAGYAQWYSQYMQGRFGQDTSARAFSSDRASVHSGQSSSHQRQGISTPQETVDDLTREEEVDYTPRLYDSAHIRGNMDGQGRLIVVDPHYPLDKQRATVNICHLSQISLDSDSEDFFQSPGPFIPGVTHRNTVLQYLKRISDRSVKSSEKLLYDLIYMTVKGNGEVNGSDVAELLMDSYKKSIQNGNESTEDAASPPAVSGKKVTARFRELLQQGNKAEALDWAIDNDAWGHALFLASKMDERTHNNIMLRFANSIPHNDPLQTLYQLMSGFVPQAATCCADKKWSDWRPHLAMILSNPTGNANLDRQAIITLGDSLNVSGRLFASHFCYVTAQVEFSEFRPDAQLVLLGSSPDQEFSKFASCRAIMLTMCYEYGLKLRQPSFSIPTLQIYKLILAARLIDSGRIRNALQYCELLAQEMLSGTTPIAKSLLTTVIDFSARLKMFDPVLALSGNTERDPDWLSSLRQLSRNLPDDYTSRSNNCSPLAIPEANPNNDFLQEAYKVPEEQKPLYAEPVPMMNTMEQQVFQPPQMPIPQKSGRQQFQPEISENIYHQGFAPAPSMPSGYQTGHGGNNEMPGPIQISSGPDPQWGEQPRAQTQPAVVQPSAEAPQNQRNSFFKTTEEQLKLNEVGGDKKKDTAKGSDNKAKNEEQSSGWFGGIWEKIAMRPKNQMRLPDDSNPSIIWDEQKKKWVNLDGESESGGSVKPPPKVTEYVPPQNSNKYKIQKGKLMKSNYVDVMGNMDKNESLPPANLVPSVPSVMKTNYFIPPPVEGNENAPIDFISPAPVGPILPDSSDNSKQQLQGNPNHPSVYNPSRFPS